MSGYGFHWTPCRGSGGGGLIVLVAAGAVVAANGRTVEHAVTSLVEVVAITVGVVLVVGAVAAVAVWRVRRRRARAVLPVRPVILTAVREPDRLDGRQAPAEIEAPRARVSAYPRIDVQPHVVTSRAARPRCARRDGGRS